MYNFTMKDILKFIDWLKETMTLEEIAALPIYIGNSPEEPEMIPRDGWDINLIEKNTNNWFNNEWGEAICNSKQCTKFENKAIIIE